MQKNPEGMEGSQSRSLDEISSPNARKSQTQKESEYRIIRIYQNSASSFPGTIGVRDVLSKEMLFLLDQC